jgi:hypothetical protein
MMIDGSQIYRSFLEFRTYRKNASNISGVPIEVNNQLLPELSYFGGTTVLPIELDGELLLYFANYRSEDILLAPNRQ